MAKSKANKDKEDKNASNEPQDDDDFGLPELEYEALDDEEPDASAPSAEKQSSGESESKAPEGEPISEPEPTREDQPQVIAVAEKEPEEDAKVSSIFDIEEPDQDEISNVFSGGGSSTVENKPMYDQDGGEAKSFTRIIIIGAVAFVLIGFAFLWWHHKDDDQKQPVAQAKPKVQKAEPVPVKEPAAATPVKTEPVNTGPAEVVTLSDRTGRSYVIVGSFFDGDLAEDYGNELAAKGISSKIIKPFGKSRFYRVSVADYGSYSEAMNEAEKAKSSYGQEVWALRY